MESRIAPAIAAIETFTSSFGSKPSAIVRAPGRINLIGEHTDYNGGFVLPMALDRSVWIALRPREDRTVRVQATTFDEVMSFDLDSLQREGHTWIEYVKGVAHQLQLNHELRGFDGVITSDVPCGAGLSSSAALELSVARGFATSSGLEWDPIVMAQHAQRAECDWVGVECGIMDQLTSAAAVADSAMLIDCRTHTISALPLPVGFSVVVLDTGTRRRLQDSAYNERRQQCRNAAEMLGVAELRDVPLTDLERAARRGRIDDTTFRRARHVVTENERTLLAVAAMGADDVVQFGELINASHRSLRDDFQVSSVALDVIVDVARGHSACVGARLSGAGFAGCAVALVDSDGVESFESHVLQNYEERTGLSAVVFESIAASGAMEIDITRFM